MRVEPILFAVPSLLLLGVVFGLVPSQAQQPPRQWLGLTHASRQVAVSSDQAGLVVEVNAAEGDTVKRGQPLFRLESAIQQLQVERLEVLRRSDSSVRMAQVELEHAKRECQRCRDLSAKKLVSDAAWFESKYLMEVARVKLAKAEEDAALTAKDLEVARANLKRRTVRAPFAGVVTVAHVQAGETVERLRPVLELATLDPLKVEIHCNLEDVKHLPVGAKVTVGRVADPADSRTATVEFVSRQADPSSQSIRVRIALRNDKREWRSGVKVKVSLPSDQ